MRKRTDLLPALRFPEIEHQFLFVLQPKYVGGLANLTATYQPCSLQVLYD